MKPLAIFLLFWGVAQAGQPLRASGPEEAVQLVCPASALAHPGNNLLIRCKIFNHSKESIYLVANAIVLEGPQEGVPYVYSYVGGERYENVLQYNLSGNGLDLPVLFKPTIHLHLEDLSHFVEVPSGSTEKVEIRWPDFYECLSQRTLDSRVKLIYLPGGSARNILAGSELPEGCRRSLARSMRDAKMSNIILKTKRTIPGRGHEFNGCRDIISEKFRHLYSSLITLRKERSSARDKAKNGDSNCFGKE